MRKALSMAVLLLVLIPAVPPGASAPGPEWTIMIYMGGGYEQGIADAMKYDLAEMERAGYREGFNIIVLKDGTSYGDSQCLVLKADGFEPVPLSEIDPSWGSELDMSDPYTLKSFVNWSLSEYPAEHDMLVMWGHGRGWMGMPDDEGRASMDMPSFSSALKEISERHGKLDVLGFDQCNMAMFETFYQIAPYADFAVASEKEEDMAGWPYDAVLSHIYGMENPDGPNVSMTVVRDYVSWASNNSQYSATMSAIDLSKMDSVASSLSDYSYNLERFLPYYKEEITIARVSSESYDRLPYPYDLVNLTENIEKEIKFPALTISGHALADRVEDAVILERHHTVPSDMSVEGASGMSIWFPSYGSREDYRDLRVRDTGWPDFLDTYLSSVPPSNIGSVSLSVNMLDRDGDGANESLSATALGNGTVYLDIYLGDSLLRNEKGDEKVSLNFEWGPGYFTIVSYLMNGSSIENYSLLIRPLEKTIILYGYLEDFMDQPATATVELITPRSKLVSKAEGRYSIELTAPYQYMPGDNATLRVCSSSCEERQIWLNSNSIRIDLTVSSGIEWKSALAAVLIFLLGTAGYFLLFDIERKEKRVKKFKKVIRMKKIKKVIWVKDITDRRKELSELKNALKSAKEGKGATIFLTGEEGVGKRTLMEKFRQEGEVKSVFYECRGTYEGRPYDALRKVIDMLKDMGLSSIKSEELFSGGSREMLFESTYQTIRDASAKEPLVISIFNAQWLDDASVNLLNYIARGMDETHTLLIVSAPQEELEDRDGMPHPLNTMLMNLIIEGKVRMIKLERFDKENTRKMVSDILGTEIPDESLEKIYELSRGLPEMIYEIALAVKHSGADLKDPDTINTEVPSTVKGLVSRRLAKLDEKERKTVEWAAILGNTFTFDELKAISDIDSLNTQVYGLIEDRVISEESGVYSFDHPEIRNRILEELGEKAENMHQKAGNTLEKMKSSVYALAYQFCSAGNGKKCMEYSLKAANKAESAYAPDEAVRHYLNALRFSDEDRSYDILISLSDNYYTILEYEKAIDCANKIVYSGAPEEMKERARVLLGKCYLENSMWDDAGENYELLIKSGEPKMRIEGHRGLGKIYWRLGEHDKAAEMIKEAIKLSDNLGDILLSGSTRIDMANIYSDVGRYDDSIKLYLDAIDVLERAGELREVARAYNNLGEVYRYSGNMEKAVKSYLKCIEYAENTGDINIKGYGLSNTGTVYAHLGKVEEAKEYLDKAHRIFKKTDNKFILSGIAMAYGMVYTKEKKWDAAEREFLNSIEMLEEIDVKYDLALSYLEYARMLGDKGDKKAREMYTRARELFESIGSEDHIKKVDMEMSNLKGA